MERTRTEYDGVGSSKVRAGSSITDELREWMRVVLTDDDPAHAIADRIDERHDGIIYDYQREYKDFMSYRDIAYAKLPVDVDGVPIHVGDTIEIEHNGRVTTVTNINYNEYGWQVYCSDGGGFDKDTRCRHVKPDTWERIIQDAVKLGYADYPTTSYEAELVERCKKLAGE